MILSNLLQMTVRDKRKQFFHDMYIPMSMDFTDST